MIASPHSDSYPPDDAATGKQKDSPNTLQTMADRLTELRHERERLTDRLREQTAKAELLSSVVLRCQNAANVKGALRCALVNICLHTGWPVGHAYRSHARNERPDNALTPAGILHVADARYDAEFVQTIEHMSSPPGASMLERALNSRKPAWIRDVREEGGFPAQAPTDPQPLVGAFAVPVEVEGSVEAVLEFFSHQPVEPDQVMLDVAEQIARELGAMIYRKRAETLIKSSARRFRHLAERAPAPLVTFNQHGQIKHVNHAAERFLGSSRAELLGQSIEGMLPQRDQLIYRRFVRWLPTAPGHRHLMQKPFQAEVCQKNGTKVPVEYALATLYDEREKLYTAVVRDLRRRHQVKTRARQTQRRLRRLLLEVNLREQQERQRVAHQLHEDLAQILAGCQMHLGPLSGDMEADQLDKTLEKVLNLVRRALEDVRTISYQLSPPALHEMGLARALDWLANELREQSGVEVEIEGTEWVEDLDQPVCLVIYELVREMINKLVHERGSRRLRIEMSGDGKRRLISLESVAPPVTEPSMSTTPPASTPDAGGSLFAAIEQLTYLGGTMSVERSEASGSRIRIMVPIAH